MILNLTLPHPLLSWIVGKLMAGIPYAHLHHAYREATWVLTALLPLLISSMHVDFVLFDVSPTGLLVYFNADILGIK